MLTEHRFFRLSSTSMNQIEDGTVDLVVTSPPYPMIEMWDDSFGSQDPDVGRALGSGNGPAAFESMHRVLDDVWRECARVLGPGRFLCVNIGDAARTIGGNFRLYTNHARITSFCESVGFQSLPAVLWRKQTNAPNKFMGSGMLPSGAYVTLEHEHILIFRKGGKRSFSPSESGIRRRSAHFWEERNAWFSDIWDFKGTRQLLENGGRERSGAFPLELAHRLVCMYSLQGDLVLDPFMGTGTTAAACLLNGRNSAGYEIDPALYPTAAKTAAAMTEDAGRIVDNRLLSHDEFVRDFETRKGKTLLHTNSHYGFRVMTLQETDLRLPSAEGIERLDDSLLVCRHCWNTFMHP